jgi:DUF1365 family protein
MNSCLYHGVLRHRRLLPKTHTFRYSVFMAWLDLDELEALPSVGIRRNRFAAAASMMQITRWAHRLKTPCSINLCR